jgi:YD repeat-containing protein
MMVGFVKSVGLRARKAHTLIAASAVVMCIPLSSVSAQDPEEGEQGSVSPPSDGWSLSPGNVDLRSGTYAYSKTDLSLGGIELTRSPSSGVEGKHNPFGSFDHNFEIFAVSYLHPEGTAQEPNYRERLSVYIGGKPTTFHKVVGSSFWTNQSYQSGAIIDNNEPILTYIAPDGTKVIFASTFGGCSVTMTSGACAYATQIINPDGTRIDLTYDNGPSGSSNYRRLRRATNSKGYAVLFEYSSVASKNVITKACAYNLAVAFAPTNNVCNSSAAQTTSYTYANVATRVRMATSTDVLGHVWTYSHTDSGGTLTQSFYQPGEATAYLTNTIDDEQTPEFGENGKVTRQDFADGTYFTYTYALVPGEVHGDALAPRSIFGGNYSNTDGTSWGALGDIHPVPLQNQGSGPSGGGYTVPGLDILTYRYQVTPGPTNITPPNGFQSNSTGPGLIVIDYCDRIAKQTYPDACFYGPIQRKTYPEGNYSEFWWELAPNRVTRVEHHPKPGSSDPVLVQTAEYNCSPRICKAKPTAQTDANGNRSDMEYSTVHGGMTRSRGPAVGGIRPETRYTYAQKYAWLKNSGSGYSQAADPIWVRTSQYSCISSAMDSNGNCAAGANDKVTTTYEYEQGSSSKGSNLLRLGSAITADGQTLRTCMTYDAQGRPISETQPNANLATCQ